GKKLGRNTSHRRALLRNLVTSLVLEERIQTTVPKAKAMRPLAERMVTLGKRGSLPARRQAASYLLSPEAVAKLFDSLSARFGDRAGGYTASSRPASAPATMRPWPTSSSWGAKACRRRSASSGPSAWRRRRRRRRRLPRNSATRRTTRKSSVPYVIAARSTCQSGAARGRRGGCAVLHGLLGAPRAGASLRPAADRQPGAAGGGVQPQRRRRPDHVAQARAHRPGGQGAQAPRRRLSAHRKALEHPHLGRRAAARPRIRHGQQRHRFRAQHPGPEQVL